MRWITLGAIGLLASCSGQARQAERAYDLASKGGNNQDRCDAATAVAAAYQQDGNEAEYAKWRQKQSDDCLMARMAAGSANGDQTEAERQQEDAILGNLSSDANLSGAY